MNNQVTLKKIALMAMAICMSYATLIVLYILFIPFSIVKSLVDIDSFRDFALLFTNATKIINTKLSSIFSKSKCK